MVTPMQEHTKHFREWCITAYEQYSTGAGRTALIQGRLCAEAACVIIIYHHWPVARAKAEMQDSNLQDLISLIQRHSLAPQQVVSALHALRSEGNKASHHGQQITTHDVEFGITSLKFLADHLFGVILNMPVPKAINEASQGGQRSQRLEQELEQVKAQLASNIRDAQAQGMVQEEANIAEQVRLRNIEAQLQELLALKNGPVIQREPEPAAMMPVLPPVEQAPPPEYEEPVVDIVEVAAIPKKGLRKGLLVLIPMLVLVVVVTLYFLIRSNDPVAHEIPVAEQPEDAHKYNGRVDVLILPFTIMQDDPYVDLRMEELIRKRLEDRAKQLPLPLTVTIGEGRDRSYSEDDALEMARTSGASLVFFGDIYEPLAKDSGSVIVHFAAPEPQAYLRGKFDAYKFRTLTDSGSVKTQLAVQAMAEMAMNDHLFARQRYQDVLDMLQRTPIMNDGIRYSVHYWRSLAYSALGEGDLAEGEAKAAVAAKEVEAGGHHLLAKALNARGLFGEAVPHYERAIELDPGDVTYVLELARLLGRPGPRLYYGAERWHQTVDKLLAIDPSIPEAWYMKGLALQGEFDHTGARGAFEKAIQLDPAFGQAQFALASELIINDPIDHVRAKQLLHAGLQYEKGDMQAQMLLAQLERNQALLDRMGTEAEADEALARKDYKHALSIYRQLFSRDSSDLRMGSSLSTAYFRSEKFAEGEKLLLFLLSQDSLQPILNGNLGALYLRAAPPYRNYEKAERYFRIAMRRDPHNEKLWSDLALSLFRQTKFEEAVEAYKQVLALAPKDATAFHFMGMALVQLERYDQAVLCFERAIQNDPLQGVFYSNLALGLYQLGPPHTQRAITNMQKALELEPIPANHLNMARIYKQAGDAHNCQKHYDMALAMDQHRRDAEIENWIMAREN